MRDTNEHLPELPPFEEIDIEKLAMEYAGKQRYWSQGVSNAFIAGYKAAQSKSKQFSLEDMEAAFEAGDAACIHRVVQQRTDYMTFDKFIQSLSTQQPSQQFTLEDIKKAIEMAREEDGWSDNTMGYSYTEEEIIQQLPSDPSNQTKQHGKI